MCAKKRKRKNVVKAKEVIQPKNTTFKYIISGQFTWKGFSYNVGEALPDFMPVAVKNDLWEQGKLSKIDAEGNRIKCRPVKDLNESEIYAIVANPYGLSEWFDRFEISIDSLKLLLAQFKTRNMDIRYIALIEKEIERNGEKEKDTGALRRSDDKNGALQGGQGTGEPVSQG
jgi:hypothetical protein